MTLAFRILKNREDAEEAVQDAFMRTFKSLHSFDERSSLMTWFYRIVYNVCLTKLDRHKKIFALFDRSTSTEDLLNIMSQDTTDANLERVENAELLEQAINSLPPQMTTVLTLFYVQEMSYDEIVSVTGMPLGTVKTNLFRGRTAIRETLRKQM